MQRTRSGHSALGCAAGTLWCGGPFLPAAAGWPLSDVSLKAAVSPLVHERCSTYAPELLT